MRTKLVSKKWTSGICISRRVIRSIFISIFVRLCPKTCHPERSEPPGERSRRTPCPYAALPALTPFSPPLAPPTNSRPVRPTLIPPPQQKRSIAATISLVAKHRQPVMKCLEKLLAIPILHCLGAIACFRRCFPLVDRRGNRNARRDFLPWHRSIAQQLLHAFRFQPPFRNQPVRRKAALQRRSRDSILVDRVAPHDCPQFLDIEIGVFDFQRIKRPLDQLDAPLERLFALKQLDAASQTPVAVLAPHRQHV